MKSNEPIGPEYYRRSNFNKVHYEPVGGLTKREYFAAMAMQGILSTRKDGVRFSDLENLSEDAALFADALITELNKEQK